jgi:hypothetical protein
MNHEQVKIVNMKNATDELQEQQDFSLETTNTVFQKKNGKHVELLGLFILVYFYFS